MKNLFANATAIALFLSAGATAVQAHEISYSSHLPPSVTANSQGIIPFFEAVAEEATSPVEIKYFWAGSLFNAAGNFEAVRDGTVDAAFTQPQSNQADMRVNAMFADLIHYGGNPYATAAAYTQTLLLDCPRCAEDYSRNGVRFMGAHSATPAALICNSAVTSIDDLRGRRLIGQPGYSRWAQALGATQLDVPPPQQMEAIQRGQGDCTFAAREWLTSFSLQDIAHTIVDVPVGAQFAISLMTFNEGSWNALPQDIRDAMIRNMPLAIARVIDASVKREEAAMETAVSSGVVVTDLGGTYGTAFAEFMEGQRARVLGDAERRGIDNAEEVIDTFVANVAHWNALIAEHGTENFAQLLWDEIYSQLDY
ncbi:hypothetical protein [Roseinatronobacter alkalisoli]|uniref:C4-dicarboxylate ABC transporter substrate-binding protein n=1 Tax=Roseinatronobacter alkalisoli TaxID=3028235 RepID=A0ABT5TAN3_9RHOB|nr:hypothetical protein [Roseinatronobacter sp. HJB301]MDD7972176.1 hypothetical protein [Roseinatronobacter sp. HJB301]